MYAKVVNGQVTFVPTSGILQDSRTVSNYNLLPESVLLAEGWKPIKEVKPEYDEATQYLVVDTAVDKGDKITVTYKAIDIPLSYLDIGT